MVYIKRESNKFPNSYEILLWCQETGSKEPKWDVKWLDGIGEYTKGIWLDPVDAVAFKLAFGL
jgi:hypothetical protein